LPVVEEMRSLLKSNVLKSANIIRGEKKELEIKIPIPIIEVPTPAPEEEILVAEEAIDLQKIKGEAEAILREAQLQREEILVHARKESDAILEEAYQDSQRIFEKARKEGHDKGLLEGKEQGYLEMEGILQEAAQLKSNAFEERRRMAKELEVGLIHLVIDTVKRVLRHEMDEHHELLLNLIQEGIDKCTFTDTLVIKVSQRDFDVINNAKHKIYMMTQGIEHLEVKCDPALPVGSVHIETSSGSIDASIETQIEIVEKLFEELLRSE